MDRDDPFKGCWDRLARAERHRDEAIEAWNAFLGGDEDAYELGLVMDQEREGVGRGTLRVWQGRKMPSDLPILIGEVFYNLRAALDAAIYATAVIDNGWTDPPPNANVLQFPICDTPEQFRANAFRIAPLTDRHQRWVEQVQPYAGGEDPKLRGIYWLNHLSRLDRHRGLRVVGGYISEANIAVSAKPGSVVTFDPRPEKVFVNGSDSTVIASFTVAPWERGDEVDANPNAALDIEIEDFASGRPADAKWLYSTLKLRLFLIATVIDTEVGRFEFDTTRSTRSKYLAKDWPGFFEN
jgi:hypothetical protein